MFTRFTIKQRKLIFLALLMLSLPGCKAQAKDKEIMEVIDIPLAEESSSFTTRTYINTKYSFVFSYPRIFDRKKDFQDGDGIYFTSDERSLLIWGSPSSDIAKIQGMSAKMTQMAMMPI